MTSNLTLSCLAILICTAVPAVAQSKVDRLCGSDHGNEATSATDIVANPDGYYVVSLGEQLSHGDPRIILAVGKEFHLCTRSVATHDMDATHAPALIEKRSTKYLFVPNVCPKKAPTA